MLSLNKKLLAGIFFLFVFMLIGCDRDSKDPSTPIEDYLSDNQKLLAHLKKNFDPQTEVALYSQFGIDSSKEILAIKETKPSKTDKWGLKIQLLSADSLKKKDEVFLPEMSATESICTTQKLDSFSHDLFYYNSGSFYTGSSGGEIFAYLVDFPGKQIYYAHLIISPNKPAALFFSKNCSEQKVKDFFLNLFKSDYPELVVVQKDILSE